MNLVYWEDNYSVAVLRLQQTIGLSAAHVSKAEFIAKMGVVVEEADETVFWLEMFTETGILETARAETMMVEANELLAIFASSLHTAKYGKNGSIKK